MVSEQPAPFYPAEKTVFIERHITEIRLCKLLGRKPLNARRLNTGEPLLLHGPASSITDFFIIAEIGEAPDRPLDNLTQ